MSSYAIYFEPSAYSLKGKVMGRQSAGAAFLQALANTKVEQLWCYSRNSKIAQECAQMLSALGSPRTGIAWIPLDQPQNLAKPGLLYRPDPILGQHAWHRLARSEPRAYSICGLTHTLSTHAPMSAFADYLTSPLETWDALICTSTAGRDAVRYVLEQAAEALRDRVGAQRFTLPQLPVIPLGVHARDFTFTADERMAARQRLGLDPDEVAVLYAGRLIVHGKAHPLPVYLALEKAAEDRKVVLIQAGKSPNDQVMRIYTEEPKRFCPSVRTIMVDGDDFPLYRAAWAGADIFTSLSDNIQETFGLTPIEAMASGLPVVVSDWDGYRDTVRDGVDGFRVPTLTLPPGRGFELADRYDLGLDDFDMFSAYTSQLVAVDIEATAKAYRQLIDDAGLRRKMGAAGAQRVRECFDWAVVFKRYHTLWAELAERRRGDPQLNAPLSRRRRPDRPDPFSMFATYPTFQVGQSIAFRRRIEISAAEAISRRDLLSTSFAKAILPSPILIQKILDECSADWIYFDEIANRLIDTKRETIASALVWLSKVGVIDFDRRNQ